MKKLCVLLLAIVFFLTPLLEQRVYAAPPMDLASGTAILMDADTGQVLYDKGMSQKVYPASTTKILTALLVVENTKPYEIMTVSATAVEEITYDNSHIALTEGEQLTVENALYALMLPSANDAANVLAEHVAGSQEAFAKMMTEKAHEIGAVNSNFANAHGLHDDKHYTTAYDMALITRYAMRNEDFRLYFGTDRYTMPKTNKNSERPFTNYQYMLVKETGYYNPDVIGGKVGFTNQAQNTMSTVARRGDRTLVCVVMHSVARGDKFADTGKLLNFGFDEFTSMTVFKEDIFGFQTPIRQEDKIVGSAVFSANEDFSALIHLSADPSNVKIRYDRPETYEKDAPIECIVSFEMAEAPAFVPPVLGALELAAAIKYPSVPVSSPDTGTDSEPLWLLVLKTAGILLGCVLIVLLLFIAYRRYQIRKRRRQRKERLERKQREAAMAPSVTYKRPPVRSAPGRTGYAQGSRQRMAK